MIDKPKEEEKKDAPAAPAIAVGDIVALRSRMATLLISAEHEMLELETALTEKRQAVEQYRGALQAFDSALKLKPVTAAPVSAPAAAQEKKP
jgi:hypothetical protein